MRAPSRLHALIVFSHFDRLRVFPKRSAAKAHQQAQVRRLKKDFPDAAEVWKSAELVSYARINKMRKKR